MIHDVVHFWFFHHLFFCQVFALDDCQENGWQKFKAQENIKELDDLKNVGWIWGKINSRLKNVC